jgi:putative ABC transport system ATP-binding protein
MRVELKGIAKGYRVKGGTGGMVTVLDGIDLMVESGDSCIIYGPSGSGKSTLLTIIAGLASAGSGKVLWDGAEAARGIWNRKKADDIGYAYQEPLLLDELTVWENLILPAMLNGRNDLGAKGEGLLEECGLSDRFDCFPEALSGGEKRRLAVAMALILPYRLLIIDEPTAYLDDTWGGRLMEIVIREANANNATLLVASHDARLRPYFRKAIKMDGGRLNEESCSDN